MTATARPVLSIVVPVFNERDCIGGLLDELANVGGLGDYEVICVDDASTDDTLSVLRDRARAAPRLHVLSHARRAGQSAAVRTGVKAARATWVATLDGDGQNDPADLTKLLSVREASETDVKLFGGWRVHRRDSGSKRIASVVANRVRATLLRDDTPDTGCGIKLFEREAFLELPAFDHMHRYLPALMQRSGWTTRSVPVHHRPRSAGASKYGNLARAVAGLYDLVGMLWLLRRNNIAAARAVAIHHGDIDGPDEPADRGPGLDRPAHDAMEAHRPDGSHPVRAPMAGPVRRDA